MEIIKNIHEVVLLASSILALGGALLAALWAYAKFILERGLLPSIQFDVDFTRVGQTAEKALVDICLHIKNMGSATLVARNIRIDVLYLLEGVNDIKTFDMSKQSGKIGRIKFDKKLSDYLHIDTKKLKPTKMATEQGKQKEIEMDALSTRGILILKYDTFVEPGVDQRYPFFTTLPIAAKYVLIWGSFEYGQKPSRFQEQILRLARAIHLVQYGLNHISKPHTVEKVFALGDRVENSAS